MTDVGDDGKARMIFVRMTSFMLVMTTRMILVMMIIPHERKRRYLDVSYIRKGKYRPATTLTTSV